MLGLGWRFTLGYVFCLMIGRFQVFLLQGLALLTFYWFMAWELCFRPSSVLDLLLQFCIFIFSFLWCIGLPLLYCVQLFLYFSSPSSLNL